MQQQTFSKEDIKLTLPNGVLDSTLKIIGYHPLLKKQSQQFAQKLNFQKDAKSFIPYSIKTSQTKLKQRNHQNKCPKINPLQIIAQNNTIGIIDQNKNAWIISEIFRYPINLSLLIKKKVKKMYLNQKQVILQTSKQVILVNWGARKLFANQSLTKIPTYDRSLYDSFFQAFTILQSPISDSYYFSNLKKSQNSNKMYKLTNQSHLLIGYPTLQKYAFNNKIIGISIGKYHSLCWDENGILYSWGTRSLGLGYDSLPLEDYIEQPLKVNLRFKVKMAFASYHYSLAISTEGKLYQWGIKKDINQINDQLIFQPRLLKFKYFNLQHKKFTCLKGTRQKFGIICSSGQLFVWGQKTRIFVHPNANIPKDWQNGRLYQPYLVHTSNYQKIIDFSIQQGYLSLITAPKSCIYRMKQQTQYWETVVKSVRTKFDLKKYRKMNTQASCNNSSVAGLRISQLTKKVQQKQVAFNKQLFRQSFTVRRESFNRTQLSKQCKQSIQNPLKQLLLMNGQVIRDDPISIAQYSKKSKEQYINKVKNQQILFTELMQQKQNQINNNIKPRNKSTFNRDNRIYKKFQVNTQRSNNNTNQYNQLQKAELFQLFKKSVNIPHFMNNLDYKKVVQLKSRKKIQFNNFLQSSRNFQKSDGKKYQQRLKQVLQKKRNLQRQDFNLTLKRVEENSLQFRMKRHEQLQVQKNYEKQRQLLKNTLQKYLIKMYLVKLISSPLALGRAIKIQNFARTLKLQRVQKNIRKIFIKAKVRFAMKNLKNQNFSRFTILMIQWKRYVAYFRQKKYLMKRKFIVQQLVTKFAKYKMRLGLYTSNLNVRKIQKFRQWLVLVKNQRMKCLKNLWRIQIYSIMKISQQGQSAIQTHLPKGTDELTFQSLYNQRVQQNSSLKLINFLNKCPLFKIKLQYFRTVGNLFARDKVTVQKSQKIINILSKTKKSKIKFIDEDDPTNSGNQVNQKLNLLSTDIYPYSLHYNIFTKPKNYDIIISEFMKKNQKWIKQEKFVLDYQLQNFIISHQRNFRKKCRQYDVQLANFIHTKYETFCQKRWKYIIEYNQIEKNNKKKKQQKQLYRVMNLIGMARLLDQDCLPQKQAILQQAKKRKQSPKQPNAFIVFSQRQFRQLFKSYYQQINCKAKQIRKLQN